MKQTYTCARILMGTNQQDNINTAMEMMDEIINDFPYNKEQAAYKTAVRMHRAEWSGARRAGARWVPIYTKAFFLQQLENTHSYLGRWIADYTEIVKTTTSNTMFVQFVEQMLGYFVDANIEQWEYMYDQQIETLEIGKARYNAVYNNYTVSLVDLEEAQQLYEDGINRYIDEQTKKAKRGFLRGLTQVFVGIFVPGMGKKAVSGVQDIVGVLKNMEETMEFLAQTMERTNAMMEKLAYMMDILTGIIQDGDLEDLAGDIELIGQLYVAEVGWDNLKENSHIVVQDSLDKGIGGAAEYLMAMTNTCNWGKALTQAMIELSENYRQAVLISSILASKNEMRERYTGYLDETKANIAERRDWMLLKMNEMQHDIRLDANELLIQFCDYVFYEDQNECRDSTKPTFDATMPDMQNRLSAAISDGLFGSGVPGSICRPVSIVDSNTDPDCTDVAECPINMFRKTRIFHYTVPRDHPDLNDIQRYRVGKIDVNVIGAKTSPGAPNNRLKFFIESTSVFSLRRSSTWYDFITRPLRLVHEYDIVSGAVTWRANLYDVTQSSRHCHHRSPFATWIMRLDSPSIDISDVTAIEVTFDGTGFPVRQGDTFDEESYCLTFKNDN